MDYLNQFTSLVVNLSVKHQVTVLVTCFLFGILVYSLCARIYRKKLALMEKDRLEDQKSSLVSLATSKEIRSGNLESSFQKIVKESSNKLNSSVSTIWLVEKDNFKCVTGYDHDKNRFITEYKVLSEDYPNFYKTLQRVRINAISDITKSGLQFEFKKLLNNGIRAVLSTPIRVDGELTAFLCHCNRGEPREWTLSEENYAASIADITSMFIHSSEKQKFTEQINRLVHAIESSVDGMAILDTQGKYVYMNDVHAEIFGYSNSKELISKSWEVLYEEEERERISNKILPNLVAGKSLRLETEGKKKDGSKFPQEAILTLSHDGGLVCVCRDISEKKRVEAEIKQLAEYTTLNPSPVFRFNFTGKITHSNPAAAKLKITRDTQYLNLLKLIPQLTLSDLEKCIEQNETISYTTCIGDYCFLIVLQGVASQRSGYAYATDITSQQAAETNLKKSKKFLRTIIDLDPNFIFVKDREGRFTLVNKAVADAYGTTPEKLVGKKDIDFNDQIQEVEHFREADIRVIVGNEELFIPEEEITDSGGNIRYLQTVKKPLRLSDEEESVVLGVSTDITKQKELQSQLFHAQKMEAVGQLAGGIAHDFNNLLTGILGYATLIKSKDLEDNEHFSIADKLIKAAERAAELTQKLLGFARKGKNQNIPINLHSIIEETVSMLDRIIEDNVRIKLDLSDFDPVIRGDPTQIQQVVLNLALNARDAMSESLGGTNGGVLNISTKLNKHNEEKYVVLTFEDTGCGIPKSIQSRIFEPFFTTKPNRRGTGMGLAMVYGIVENHGGKISIKSITGEGTSFEIVFPCVKSDQKIMTLKKENNFLKGKGSIMVVDDNQIVLSVTADMLKALGYKVETANNGWQAIKKYKVLKNEIDLLILDLVMPDLGAEETFLQLQKINPKIKVMLSTGYEASQSVQKVLDLGMLGFIQKPYEMSKLSKAISSVLTSAAFEQSA